MDNDVLKDILQELKGLRGEAVVTNRRLEDLNTKVDGLNQRVDGLNDRVDGLNGRVDGLNRRVDGLNQSVVVLQQGVSDLRYEMRQVKEILAEKVIWQNDTISIATKEGSVIYGVIQKEKKK